MFWILDLGFWCFDFWFWGLDFWCIFVPMDHLESYSKCVRGYIGESPPRWSLQRMDCISLYYQSRKRSSMTLRRMHRRRKSHGKSWDERTYKDCKESMRSCLDFQSAKRRDSRSTVSICYVTAPSWTRLGTKSMTWATRAYANSARWRTHWSIDAKNARFSRTSDWNTRVFWWSGTRCPWRLNIIEKFIWLAT